MKDLAITVQDWWEKAQASGRIEFETLTNLAKCTGLSVAELEKIFGKEVTFLGEWWEVIGKFVYKSQRILAEKLGRLGGFDYPRSTLTDQFRGATPAFVEYRRVLFAVTALPILNPELTRLETELETGPKIVILSDKLKAIIAAQSFGEALLRELDELNQKDLTPEEREILTQLFKQIEDRFENWELSQQLNELFQEEE